MSYSVFQKAAILQNALNQYDLHSHFERYDIKVALIASREEIDKFRKDYDYSMPLFSMKVYGIDIYIKDDENE